MLGYVVVTDVFLRPSVRIVTGVIVALACLAVVAIITAINIVVFDPHHEAMLMTTRATARESWKRCPERLFYTVKELKLQGYYCSRCGLTKVVEEDGK